MIYFKLLKIYYAPCCSVMSVNNEQFDEEYERQYMPSNWSKREHVIQQFVKFITTRSFGVVDKFDSDINVSYGNGINEKIDYFYPPNYSNSSTAPVIVYLHGGYWVEGDRSHYHFLAQTFCSEGYVTAIVGYNLAPSVTIPQIKSECVSAVKAILLKFSKSKITLIGHSAGAYLVAAVCHNSITDMISNLFLLSGVYDLEPLSKTSLCEPLKLGEDKFEALNLMKQNKECFSKIENVFIVVGENESPSFHQQNQSYKGMLISEGVNVICKVIDGEDHFSIVEKLADKSFTATRMVIDTIEDQLDSSSYKSSM